MGELDGKGKHVNGAGTKWEGDGEWDSPRDSRLGNEGEAADRPKGHGGDNLGLVCASVCAASISAATALREVLAAITIIAAVVDLNLELHPWIGTGKNKSKMKQKF